ncbi:MAG: DUF4926 domain-containing protein [Candidatus Latescibacteria bacterium]|nr:DUF4926 domain-containing protein [Candidatus Latescibacterota bacterium]
MIEAGQDRPCFVTAYPVASYDVRAVVHSYREGAAFEVEFVTAKGSTVALLTLPLSPTIPRSATDFP